MLNITPHHSVWVHLNHHLHLLPSSQIDLVTHNDYFLANVPISVSMILWLTLRFLLILPRIISQIKLLTLKSLFQVYFWEKPNQDGLFLLSSLCLFFNWEKKIGQNIMENETEAVKTINKINRDLNCNKVEIQIIPLLWPRHVACGILVPRPEMEPVSSALET